MLSIIIELCTKTHIKLKAFFILLCNYRTTFDNSLSGKKKNDLLLGCKCRMRL